MSQTRLDTSGSKTVTYVGTGPAGATTGGGLIKEETQAVQPVSDALDNVRGKVLLQGNVVKSVVSHELTNTGVLEFKGKTTSATSNPQNSVVKPIKRGAGDALGDITVAGDATKCVVTVKMSTNGISFDDDDD